MFKWFNVQKENHPVYEDDIMETSDKNEDFGQVAVDVLESDDKISIVAPLAGMDLDDIDVSLDRNILTIKGTREKLDIYESHETVVSECFYGEFSRSVILPENLAFDQIKATMEDNLLTVSIPKLTPPSQSVKIEKLED